MHNPAVLGYQKLSPNIAHSLRIFQKLLFDELLFKKYTMESNTRLFSTIYSINNLIKTKSFEARVIWNYGQNFFNNIFQFLPKSNPA